MDYYIHFNYFVRMHTVYEWHENDTSDIIQTIVMLILKRHLKWWHIILFYFFKNKFSLIFHYVFKLHLRIYIYIYIIISNSLAWFRILFCLRKTVNVMETKQYYVYLLASKIIVINVGIMKNQFLQHTFKDYRY